MSLLQVCRVLGYCFKEQRFCPVMLHYAGSLTSVASGQYMYCDSSSRILYSSQGGDTLT